MPTGRTLVLVLARLVAAFLALATRSARGGRPAARGAIERRDRRAGRDRGRRRRQRESGRRHDGAALGRLQRQRRAGRAADRGRRRRERRRTSSARRRSRKPRPSATPPSSRRCSKPGPTVDAPGADGQTALMVVARSGNTAAAEALIEHGADVNARERWREQTALMWAAAQNQPAMVKLLIEHGAEVDARSVVNDWPRQVTGEPRRMYRPFGGFTPLLFAAREGCLECARSARRRRRRPRSAGPEGRHRPVPRHRQLSFRHGEVADRGRRESEQVGLVGPHARSTPPSTSTRCRTAAAPIAAPSTRRRASRSSSCCSKPARGRTCS